MPSESFWFLNTRVTVHVSHTDGKDGVAVLEHRVPYGDAPPLHAHRTEDEIFVVLEGDVAFQLDQQRSRHSTGATIFTPKGIPHGYRVESKSGARFLTITAHGDFER